MKLSIVLPIYNEEESIPLLMEHLKVVCKNYAPFEIICVDDGSTDNTLDVLVKEKESFPEIKIIKFEKNCGQSDSLAAGFRQARGELVATMDADLQDPPEELSKMIEALDEEIDVVIGWRYLRADSSSKKFASTFANRFRNMFLRDYAHDTGCPLKVFRRKTLEHLPMFRGSHRFLPALIQQQGFTVKEIKVAHQSRAHGQTKYKTFGRAFPTFFDLWGVLWMKKRRLKFKIEKIIE